MIKESVPLHLVSGLVRRVSYELFKLSRGLIGNMDIPNELEFIIPDGPIINIENAARRDGRRLAREFLSNATIEGVVEKIDEIQRESENVANLIQSAHASIHAGDGNFNSWRNLVRGWAYRHYRSREILFKLRQGLLELYRRRRAREAYGLRGATEILFNQVR